MGQVRDSSSAGQSFTFVSILESYIISFEGGCKGLAVNKNHFYYCIYPSYIFTNYL